MCPGYDDQNNFLFKESLALETSDTDEGEYLPLEQTTLLSMTNSTDQTGDEQIKQERSATELNIDEILRQIVSDDHDADLDFNIDSDDHILLPFYD